MNIIESMRSDRIFRPVFKDLESWKAWEVYLKGLFALPIVDRRERVMYKEFTGLDRFAQPRKPARESYVIVGRRGGKSFISSVIAVYLAVFKDWRPFLNAGERGWIFVVATDKFQARIIKDYVEGILQSQPILRNAIEKVLKWEIYLKNRVGISVKPASYRTVRGFSIVVAICEEMAFWRSDEFANPDREILNALKPALATIPESLLIGISTPYSRAGVLYEQYSKYWGKKEGPLIWKAPTRLMNPTISPDIIAEDYKRDPIAAASEWEAEWRSDVEAFLPLEVVEAAVSPGRFELPKLENVTYHGFLDPSGGRGDSMTMGVAHQEKSGKIVLDCLRERQPPFRPKDCVVEFSKTLKSYGITSVESDRYAAEWVSTSFSEYGIKVKNSEISKSEIYLEFLPILQNGMVELLDNKKLIGQLINLERRTRAGGKDTIDHPSKMKDDVANSCCGVVVKAAKGKSKGSFFGWSRSPMYGADLPADPGAYENIKSIQFQTDRKNPNIRKG